MKIAVSIYSFSQDIAAGRLTPLDCAGLAAEMGFDAIEFVDFLFPQDADPIEYAKRLRETCERAGLPVSNFAFGADFINGSGGSLETEVEKAKRMIDLAALLGSPLARHDITTGPAVRAYQGYDNLLPRLAGAARQITAYAQEKGIRTMTENHGFFSQDSRRVEKLVNAVAHENFGLLCDIGNFLCADEEPSEAVGRIAPYAFYAHAKDFHVKPGNGIDPGQGFFRSRNGNFLRGAIIGHGNVPVLHCLRALKGAGFAGTIAIEFEGMESCRQGLQIGLENLRRFLDLA